MDLLNAHDLVELASGGGDHRISIFVPTHRGGPQTVRNRIRLRNLLRHAEQALRADGLTTAQIDALVKPARQLLDLTPLWDRPGDGLVLFLGPDEFRHLRVPLKVPELVIVSDRFVVQPLLPLLTVGGHFHVLALTQDELRLFEGTRLSLDEVDLDGLPLAVWATMPRRQPQVHAFFAGEGGAQGRTVFHGSGDDDTKTRVMQHFQRVDHALRDAFRNTPDNAPRGAGAATGDRPAPLVLAAVRSLQALYRQANTYPGLLPDGVDGNPRDLVPTMLHRRAWELVEPVLRHDEVTAAEVYRTMRGTGRTSSDPHEVCTAAHQGRVEVLFLSADGPDWITGSGTGPLIRPTDLPDRAADLDLAAIATLRHGGRVYAVAAERMPDSGPVAATFRY